MKTLTKVRGLLRTEKRTHAVRGKKQPSLLNLFFLFLVKLDLNGINADKMLTRLSLHIAMLTGNANFPTTNPSIAQLQTMWGDLKAAIDGVNSGNHALIPHRNNLLADARGLIRKLSYDIQNQSNGDYEKIKSSGFDVRKEKSPSYLPEQPANLKSTAIGNGKIKLRWKALPNADMYVIESAPNPVAGPWAVVNTSTRANFVIEFLSPGQLYYFRVFGANAMGNGNPSDPAEQRCL